MEIIVRLGQLFLALSILVLLHEFGHFFFAKIFRTRVEKFYLFFDPWFSLFKFKRGETEYGVGWLPLGGYVKIAGMIDESMDKAQMALPPQEWEFRAKPAWQRLLIMLGGVMVNFLLAFFIYIVTLFIYGEEYIPTSAVKDGIYVEGALAEAGLQTGDVVTQIDGKPAPENFGHIKHDILLSSTRQIVVQRGNEQKTITLSNEQIAALIAEKREGIFLPRIPFVAGSFASGSIGQKAGLQLGDQLVGINDKQTAFFDEFVTEIRKHPNQKITLHILRKGQPMQIEVQLDETAKIGVANSPEVIETRVEHYDLLSSVPAGIQKGISQIDSYLQQLKLIFTPSTGAYKEVGGFGTIASIFPTVWHWQSFWNLTALLSIMLAVLNILPIPALDGGHVMFTLYEIVTRRKPSEKFLEYTQIAGMIFLLGLLLYANGMDIVRLFK